MKQSAWTVAAALICLLLAGCYDTKQEITLNPDGSGRAVIESKCIPSNLLDAKAAPQSEVIGRFVEKLIQEAKGVDAWGDITCQELDDGRMLVRATAYFSDLSRFNTQLNGLLQFAVTRDKSGFLAVVPRIDSARSPVTLANSEQPESLDTILRERRQFRAIQPLLAGVLGGLKLETTIRLPGPISMASNFESNASGGLRLNYEGARVLSALENLLFDPELARHRVAGTLRGGLIDSFYANQYLYGQRAPVRAECKPAAQPVFDYATEVAAARRNFPALARRFGLAESMWVPVPPRPAVEGAPARMAMIGVDWRFDESDRTPRPGSLSWDEPGWYRLRLRAALPGTVLRVKEIKMTRALTAEGVIQNVSGINQPHPTEDWTGRTNLNFSVSLGQPVAHSRGWAELSGSIECLSAENLLVVDLITGKLKAGARGSEHSAEIESIGPAVDEGEKLVIRTDIPPERLIWLKAYADGGLAVELSRRNQMTIGRQQTYTFVTRHSIPRSGRLVAGILNGEKSVRIPFTVTNISLLGQPLAAR